ncbi:MAG: hypothetical protein ACRCSV_01180 [Chlamydiales bacterium]
MNLYHRSDIEVFEKILDQEIKLITNCQDGMNFLHLTISLLKKLREDPFTKAFISEIETKIKRRAEKYNIETLEVVEKEFIFRYKLPSATFVYRKQLVKIKWVISKSKRSSHFSPLAFISELFKKVGFPPDTPEDIISLSPLKQFWETHEEITKNGYLHSEFVQIQTELDLCMLWYRLRLLEEISELIENSPKTEDILEKNPQPGRWEVVRITNWNRAVESSHKINLSHAHSCISYLFTYNSTREELLGLNQWLPDEYLLNRKCVTYYLERLQSFIVLMLLEKEKEAQKEEEQPLTQREKHKKLAINILKKLIHDNPNHSIPKIIELYQKIPGRPDYADKTLIDMIRVNKLDKRAHKPRGPDKKPRRTYIKNLLK